MTKKKKSKCIKCQSKKITYNDSLDMECKNCGYKNFSEATTNHILERRKINS